MKRSLLILALLAVTASAFAAGVLINKQNTQFQIAQLRSCSYEVQITNQVAEVQVNETFVNNSNGFFYPRYYFPIPRGANATRLRWSYGDTWQEASISPVPQNPQGGPSSFPDEFVVYIQLMPVVFDVADSMAVNDSLRLELSYVMMLSYNFGSVTLNLKNDYSLLQSTPLDLQSLDVNVSSDKEILDFNILNVTASTQHTGHSASGHYSLANQPATANYACQILLSTAELGSWGLSTLLGEVPDEGAPGFFVFNLEEESLPADSTLFLRLNIVIDVSGSMTFENRLENAKTAAIYVLNHLEPEDYFNIILFDHRVRPLWDYLHSNTDSNRQAAISYIQNYEITGLNGTNLSGGLQNALYQFSPTPPGVKNCVLLLSDGQPTVGMTDTYQIINNVNQHITNYHIDPRIFCFGVGTEVNYHLLSALSQYTDGVTIFLESSEIVNTVSSFYDVMRNPLLLDPELAIVPPGITEVYPYPIPSIYGGIQYRIVGRYSTPGTYQMTISGAHQGTQLNLNYSQNLSGEEAPGLSFIPKIWAASKIDNLMVEYYSYPPNSAEAIALRDQITEISQSFGVVCVFTSFTSDPPDTDLDDVVQPVVKMPLRLLPNQPNPFNPSTLLCFEVSAELEGLAEIRIYNLKGQLVKILTVKVDGKGRYSVPWNGTDLTERSVSSGVYVYTVRFGKYLLHGKMTLAK